MSHLGSRYRVKIASKYAPSVLDVVKEGVLDLNAVKTRGEESIEQRLMVLKSRGQTLAVEEGIRQRSAQYDQSNVEEKGGNKKMLN